MSTPTPRTDAVAHKYDTNLIGAAEIIGFAMMLERDLAAAQLLLKVESDAVTEQGKTISSLQADLAAAKALHEQDRANYQCATRASMAVEEKLKADLAAARAEVERLREDKARLDWLEEYIVAISRLTSPDMSGIRFVGQVHNPIKATPDYPAGTPTYLKIQGQTVRAAIDQARKEQP